MVNVEREGYWSSPTYKVNEVKELHTTKVELESPPTHEHSKIPKLNVKGLFITSTRQKVYKCR